MLATRARLSGYTLLATASFLHCGTLETSHDFTGSDDFNNPAELNFRDTLDSVAIVDELHFSCFVYSSCHFHFSFLVAFYILYSALTVPFSLFRAEMNILFFPNF
jgi:hypothetical protein